MYQSRGFNPQNLFRVADSFTRPANTTAYAVSDLVANSTTAASVTPLSWTIARTVTGLVKITRALLRKSQKQSTNASFRLHLFNAIPTVATTGDNGAFGTNVSGYDKSLGWIEFVVVAAAEYADGDVMIGVPTDDVLSTSPAPMIVAPTAGRILYGLLQARATYTPASAEVFTVELECERA